MPKALVQKSWVSVLIVAVLFAALDVQFRKPQYQDFDTIKGENPIRTVNGVESPNHLRKAHLGFFDSNALKWISILIGSSILSFRKGLIFILLPLVTLFLDDLAFRLFGTTLFDTEIAVQRGYEAGDIVLDYSSGHGFDYGFNLWNGTLNKTLSQAQVDKWEHMLSELGLRPGDRLLDVGCGYGDWLAYAKSKGISVKGINISPDQANFGRTQYGLDIININWKVFLWNTTLQREYFGTFDAVTFMDTVEHYISNVDVIKMTATPGKEPTEEECAAAHQTYYDMFEMASRMLDKSSPRKRVFISMLHSSKSPSEMPPHIFACILFLTRFHSGHYPPAYQCHCMEHGECKPDVDKAAGQYHGLAKYAIRHFNLKRIDDVTEDYRMTAVKSPLHFQSPDIVWTWSKVGRLLPMALQDPYLIYKLLDVRWDMWMRMYGENYTSPIYDPAYRKRVSYQLCYWMTFELKE